MAERLDAPLDARARRIVHVTDCYKGGVRTHLDLVGRGLGLGKQTLVVLGGDMPTDAPFDDVVVIPFQRMSPLSWYRAAQKVRRIAAGSRLHGHSTFGGLVVALAARNRPFAYTPHAHVSMVRGPRHKVLTARALGVVEGRLVRPSGTLVACGREEAGLLRTRYPRNHVVTIPHGMHKGPVPSEPRDVDFLFLGRLDWQKNPEAFLAFAATVPGSVCAMAGDGPLAQKVDRIIAEQGLRNVHRLGYVEDPAAVMARARTFVLSSRYEVGVPFVCLEALSLGCQIKVLGNGPGLAEIEAAEPPSIDENMAAMRAMYDALGALA